MKRACSPTPNDSSREREKTREEGSKLGKKNHVNRPFPFLRWRVKNEVKNGPPGGTARFSCHVPRTEDLVSVRLDGFCSHTLLCRSLTDSYLTYFPPRFSTLLPSGNDRSACSAFERRWARTRSLHDRTRFSIGWSTLFAICWEKDKEEGTLRTKIAGLFCLERI